MYPVNLPWQMLVDRCATCHNGKRVAGRVAPRFNPNTLQSLCNLTRPEKSLVLRAPLAKNEGGLERCGRAVFSSNQDPGYWATFDAIASAAEQLWIHKRFDMPGFRPNKYSIREMQRFGILPEDLGPNDPVDPYETDRKYWRSFWYQPVDGRLTAAEKK